MLLSLLNASPTSEFLNGGDHDDDAILRKPTTGRRVRKTGGGGHVSPRVLHTNQSGSTIIKHNSSTIHSPVF